MNEPFYKNICQGRLPPVLDNIRYIKKTGIWLEITTLIVPGANDNQAELRDLAQFIAQVDPDIPKPEKIWRNHHRPEGNHSICCCQVRIILTMCLPWAMNFNKKISYLS